MNQLAYYMKVMVGTQVKFLLGSVKTQRDKDSFKPLFCSPHFYTKNQNHFEYLNGKLNSYKLSNTQLITLWSILVSILRRPNDWFGGYRITPIVNLEQIKNLSIHQQNHISIFKLAQHCQIKWPVKIPEDISVYNFINSVKIKPLPDVIQKSFVHVYLNIYPITVLDYEPTPQELLNIQCQGHRIITFKNDYENWPNQIFGHRDPLSFWLHDFIHAEHFFADPSNFQKQIGFYRFTLNSIHQPCWDQKLETLDFQNAFSYLISDMNSHPLHLLKTYKAIIDIHFKERAESIWQKIIESSTDSTYVANALRNINTAYFSSDDCDISLHFLNSLGAQS